MKIRQMVQTILEVQTHARYTLVINYWFQHK